MKQVTLITIIGSIIVIFFDTLTSLISHKFQIRYYLFSFGSFLIYASIGFAAFKYGNWGLSVLAAGIAGLIDSTFGWYISWVIGPGRSKVEITLPLKIQTIIFVTMTALFFGFIGGLISYWI